MSGRREEEYGKKRRGQGRQGGGSLKRGQWGLKREMKTGRNIDVYMSVIYPWFPNTTSLFPRLITSHDVIHQSDTCP